MKPKILFFLMNLNGGGAERAVVDLCNSLSADMADVLLVISDPVGKYFEEVSRDVEILTLTDPQTCRSTNGPLKRVAIRAKSFFSLVSTIKSEEPDIIFSALTDANIVASLAKKVSFSEARLVTSQRTHYSTSAKNPKGVRGLIRRVLLLRSFSYSHKVVAVSKGVAEDLIRATNIEPEKVVVVNNLLDVEKIRRLSIEPENELSFEKSEIVIGAVGRLEKHKRLDVLIRSFAILKKRHQNASLVIVGIGPMLSELQSLCHQLRVSDRVFFTGFLHNPFPLMKKFTVLAVASEREGFPNVIVQALALGVPVVSSDCDSGPKEILSGGRFGKLVTVGDPISLSDALSSIIDESPKWSFPSRASNYSPEKITSRFLSQIS